jgi:hypothetical protein
MGIAMKAHKAFAAGIIGALVVSILAFIGRTTGVPIQFVMLFGTAFGLEPGAAAWAVGMMMLLAGGGLLGLVYGWGFEALGRGGYGMGLLFGLIHAVIGGLLLGAMPAVHRQISDGIDAPGFFYASLGGIGVLAFVVVCLVYGAIIGAFYGEPLRSDARRVRVRP